jgi:arylsulfatase A-like enzyme
MVTSPAEEFGSLLVGGEIMGSLKNILLVTFDQWRGDSLSAAGHPLLKTPHVDALAAEGVYFKQHYTVTAPCGPSRASLLTGTYQHNHRSIRNGTPLDARFTNVALEMRKLGYDPALFGYTDISPDPRGMNTRDPVFNSYEGVLPGMSLICRLDEDMGFWFADLKRKGYTLPERPFDIFLPVKNYPGAEDKGYSYAPPVFTSEDSNAAFLSDSAITYIDAQRNRPWFAHLSYISPHPPFIAPEPYNKRYDARQVPSAKRAASPNEEVAIHPYMEHQLEAMGLGTEEAVACYEGKKIACQDLTGKELDQIRATYYGMINQVEDSFQRVLDHLKEIGAYDDTLIVLTSDHGEMLGDHWMLGKAGFYDQAVHIPLIIRDPRPQAEASRGRVVDAFTESVDVMPTILDLFGAPIPRQCDGAPLTAWLEGRTPKGWRREVHHEYDFRDNVIRKAEGRLNLRSDECALSAIRDDKFKYVHFAALPPLLYDLTKDPDQLTNVAQDPAYASVVAEYAQKMLSWRMMNDERVLTYAHIHEGLYEQPDDRHDHL